jgi:predicted dithiol-disulfide oxidoreductase (DUF899 family)
MNATLQKSQVESPKVVSRAEWTAARKRLMAKEREVARLVDELNADRRMLPWVKVEKDYVFDGPSGKVTLSQLFDGRSQLFIKHFMMGPGQKQQCVGCALEVDHLTGILAHLQNHDVSYAAVARAPIDEIEVVRKRMDWHFPWVSSFHNDFNYDFNVSFKPADMAAGTATYNFKQQNPGMEDLSGDSVFFKDSNGQIYHTYSVFARGAEMFLGIYQFLDVMPKGRNEAGHHSLADWARPHNMYGQGGMVEATGRYHAPSCACAAHQSA